MDTPGRNLQEILAVLREFDTQDPGGRGVGGGEGEEVELFNIENFFFE